MLRLDYLPLLLLWMTIVSTIAPTIVPSITLAQEGTEAGSEPLPATVPATLQPLPDLKNNNDRFLSPLNPVPSPPTDQEVLSPQQGFEIFDSERSRRACVEEVIPIAIERLRFEYADGTTGIYSDADLRALATPLIEQQAEGQGLTVADLCDFADRVTRKYVEDGYYTSRAFVPEQELRPEGTLTIRVVEGKITPQDIYITGLKHLEQAYIRDRIALGIGETSIFRYQDIDDQLRLLQANPLIEDINASVGYQDILKPRPAVTRLNVNVTEKSRFAGELAIDNYGSESIGAERMTAGLTLRNPSGIGDFLTAHWIPAIEGGSQLYRLTYRAPLNPQGGTLRLQTELNRTAIIQAPFDTFDITGRSENYGVSVRQPLLLKPNQEFAFSLGYSFRRNQTFIQDQGIAFNRGPQADGVSRISVLHFGQDYLYRGSRSIWALQSQLNWGTGFMDATVNGNDPDSQFLSWLFQAQNLQQLNAFNILMSRLDLQLANDGLFNAEQFLIGGANSVRGYRQNLRSGDNGIYFSTENRIQAYRSTTGRSLIQIAPFFDLGYVWDHPNNTNEPSQQNFLTSLGVGLLWDPLANLNFRLDYGYPLTHPTEDDRGQDALQSQGLHFRVDYDFD